MTEANENDDNMTPEERMAWLRERVRWLAGCCLSSSS